MARKARQRISYVLPLANQTGGHRLGVNGLAVDSENSILYTGGRDGVICAWDLNLDLQSTSEPAADYKPPATTHRQQVQAHTHWINDIALAHSNQALLSASSDITVKLWRPTATDGTPPQSIGLHSDYVKALAVPSPTSDWVASGGLDRKICLWDLNGAGQKLEINVGEDEAGSLSSREKGSVYALAATNNIICSGGPESTVRVWDARTGRRVTKLVGHTDNIRSVLVSQDGSTILTASSDRSVKVWSTTAGRCMYTLTMHDASVWSLFSSDPDLSVFYSSDKNGMVAKTDTRNTIELDEGLSVAVCQEHEGVHNVKAAGNYLWTATSRPSINRWLDVNTDDAEIDVPQDFSMKRASIVTTKSRYNSSPNQRDTTSPLREDGKNKIPLKHVLRLSNTAFFPTPIVVEADATDFASGGKRGTVEQESHEGTLPMRSQPDYAVEGQNGLIKHVMLNDRKRVLTLDTAGEVVMWDILKCVPIKSFGKRHIEDVQDEVTTSTTVANWCTVDTRTGSLAVSLEENNCFDAEMYADELDIDEEIEFRDDQRINLGKWVLRYLFHNLITEEIKRDQDFRKQLLESNEQQQNGLQREGAPSSIQLPVGGLNGWHASGPESASTVRPTNGVSKPHTPGFNIGLASPGPGMLSAKADANAQPSTVEEGAPRASTERHSGYFGRTVAPSNDLMSPAVQKAPVTPGEQQQQQDDTNTTATEGTPKDTPGKEGLFGKKFRMGSMGMSFSGTIKKMGRVNNEKPVAVQEEKSTDETESDSHSSKTDNSRVVDDNLLGTVQKIRFAYEDSLQAQMLSQQAHENGLPVAKRGIDLPTAITPSLPSETPVLKPPLKTTILIQEDRPEAGGVADLFEGTVGGLGEMCDLIEKAAPMWLGDVLLKNQIPIKDIVKISFVLEPYNGSGLPSIASDGNNRLNANRMLRTKKILAYVAERIEPGISAEEREKDPDAMKPEEYLELYCQGQIVPATMTLATIRAHLWRGGGDILLYYKANGKKEILHTPQATNIPVASPAAVASA